jgi:hypothetical protein
VANQLSFYTFLGYFLRSPVSMQLKFTNSWDFRNGFNAFLNKLFDIVFYSVAGFLINLIPQGFEIFIQIDLLIQH